jgi:hypothetical protein
MALSAVVAAAVFVVAASAAAAAAAAMFPELLTMSVLVLGYAFLVQVQAEELVGD